MKPAAASVNWRLYGLISLVLPAAAVLAALLTGLWVLTAAAVGYVFGFCLHRGDLCPASACSEVVLFRNGSKAFGIWAAIVVSMAGFALLDRLGWIGLAPQDAYWLNNLTGGAIFGAGMVLAGGCVSGCLFKSAAGNINSMAGLIAIPLGALAVQCGPLQAARDGLKAFVVRAPGGKPLTLSTLTGLEYWHLAVIFAAVTAVAVALHARRGRPRPAGATTRWAWPRE